MTLAAALDSSDQDPRHRLIIDWDNSGAHPQADVTDTVQQLDVERAATGDLPGEVALVEGAVSTELTATLGGELPGGVNAFDLLAPYRADSSLHLVPIHGTAGVTCQLGAATDSGVQLVDVFTGQLRSTDCDSGSRSVALAALDPADRLRARITLPAHAQLVSDVIGSNHKFLIAPQFVIDMILRRNGIYASPPPHPEAQISCTGHGGLAAEIGRSAVPRGVSAVIAGDDWWTDGPFDMLAVRGPWDGHAAYQEFFSRQPYAPVAGNGIGMSAWVQVGNNMGVTAGVRDLFELMPLLDHNAWRFQLYFSELGTMGGVIDIGGVNNGFAQPISTPTAWMYVGLHFQHLSNGQTRIRYRQNGVTTQGDITTPAITSTVAPFLQCTAWMKRNWSNFQVWYSYDPPSGSWPGETHTPQASIAAGLNRLTHLPDVVNVESWPLVKDIVAAEYGLCGFDASGQFFFTSRETLDPSIVTKEITADKSLIDLGVKTTVDSVRNVVTTEAARAYLRHGIIVASRDPLEFQSPVGVWTYDVPLAYGAIPFTSIALSRIPSASWTDATSRGFVAVQAAAPAVEITSDITMTFAAKSDRLGLLTVRNYSQWPVRFATTGGQAALRVDGWDLVFEPPELDEVSAPGSIGVYGERIYPIPASEWRQLIEPLREVAGGLLARLSNPLPVLQEITITYDPTLEPGQTVRLVDPDGHGSLRANVTKVRHTMSRGGAPSTVISARPIAPPGLGIADDPELGLADSTMIAAP